MSIAIAAGLCAGGFGQAKQNVDLIVSDGIVVTMDAARSVIHDGSVAVRGDSIVALGPGRTPT